MNSSDIWYHQPVDYTTYASRQHVETVFVWMRLAIAESPVQWREHFRIFYHFGMTDRASRQFFKRVVLSHPTGAVITGTHPDRRLLLWDRFNIFLGMIQKRTPPMEMGTNRKELPERGQFFSLQPPFLLVHSLSAVGSVTV